MSNPIDDIKWLSVKELKANNYNPNVVIGPELRLLEHSILTSGWIQPILVDRLLNIIDGFHRWSLAGMSAALLARDGGCVPVCVLDLGRAEAMVLTVRMNRAKGKHVAIRMADLVIELHDEHGWPLEKIAKEIGATAAEITLLYENSLFKTLDLKGYKFSKAWVPYDDRKPGETDGSVQ